MTVYCKLVASQEDIMGYITYVFEILEKEEMDRLGTKYIMCTRYPNWNHGNINIGEIGYLNFEEIQAGVDKWFDGEKMNFYNYNGIQFNKFVLEKPRDKKEYIMLITF